MATRIVAALAVLLVSGAASAAPGDFLLQIGAPGSGAGQLAAPWGVATTADGTVYVTDTGNDRVQVFARTGELLREWGSTGTGNGQLRGPTGIAVCGSTVYVADTNNDRVQLFDTAGTFLAAYAAASPHGLACDDLYLYVAETAADRVAVWEWDDYGFGPPAMPSGLLAPTAVALGPGGVYIADTGNDRVVVAGGASFGTSGSGPGQLLAPGGIAVDAGGNVYVADTGNGRIQVFTTAGELVTSFAAPGADPGQVASPSGLALDAGATRLLVADAGNDRIQAFTSMNADLQLAAVTFPAQTDLYGAALAGSVTIRNLGPGASGPSSVVVRLAPSNMSPCAASIPSLAPGAELVVPLGCALVYYGPPTGPASFTATVAPFAGGLPDPNAANDAATFVVQVNAPDLQVPSVIAPATAATMRTMPVSFTVANRGPGSAPASKVQFFLVANATTPAAAAILGEVAVPALPPQGEAALTATLTVPGNTVPGTYLLRAKAYASSLIETSTTNNLGHSQPIALAGPDLTLAGYSLPAFGMQGETLQIPLTLANSGQGDASLGFGVSIVLTRDGGVCGPPVRWCDESDDDWWLGGATVTQALAAGAQVSTTASLPLPADFIPLTWNVFAVIDGGTAVRESNEGNNTVFLGSIVVGPAATTLMVGIDIKPGSYPNSINLGSGGVVPVAILSSAGFDATTVNPLTVTLESSPVVLRGNGQPSASAQDVNGDGRDDLVVHVATSKLELTSESVEAVLQGTTFGGQAIAGTDTVNIVP